MLTLSSLKQMPPRHSDTCTMGQLQSLYERHFYKIKSLVKSQRVFQIEEVQASIKSKEEENKQTPSPNFSSSLLADRNKLHPLLLYRYNLNLKRSKVTYYSLENRAGSLLARSVKQRGLKTKIAMVHHPSFKFHSGKSFWYSTCIKQNLPVFL